MELRRTLTCTAALIGLQIAVASPAVAAVELRNEASSVQAEPASALTAEAHCSKAIAPALGSVPAVAGTAATSKAAAILGGQVSRLELIARQQAAVAPAPQLAAPQMGSPQPASAVAAPLTEVAQSVPGKGIEPAAGGFACPAGAATGLAAAGLLSGIARSPLGSNDFLASKRLPVSRTTFDAAWGRVQGGNLPQSMVRRALGGSDRAITRAHIAAINAWTNGTVRYVEDRDLYGQSDYWASARTTLKRRAGDCEDIAIAKMQLLAAMGVPRSDMYLTIARDLARNADHAMLVVKFEDEHLLLDNATNALLDGSESYDYRPILSFNSAQTWLHGY